MPNSPSEVYRQGGAFFRADHSHVDQGASGQPSAAMRAGLELLLKAYNYSRDVRRDVWDFGIEIQRLQAAGLTVCDLRWLVCKEYVQHAGEITLAGQTGRAFRPCGDLTFADRSCFVLTQQGVEIASQLIGYNSGQRTDGLGTQGTPASLVIELLPHWDSDRHELRVNGLLVKRFKLPSPNQEAVLAAFEEECWPSRIDDPLPPVPNRPPKQRLHDTVNSLNRNQKRKLIRFLGDGTGEGILWESLQNSVPPATDVEPPARQASASAEALPH